MTIPACPICNRRLDPALSALCAPVEERVARALSAAYPDWRPEDRACPACVLAARAALPPDETELLVDPWGRRAPPYAPFARIVPTPVRVFADPRYRGAGVTIALIDSGFGPHPDLLKPRRRILLTVDAGREPIVERADFSEPRLESWHGTMTACVAAGSGHLSAGLYRGIASEARLVLIKVSTPQGRIGEREIARGLEWVLANHRRLGIAIVNVSAGGDRRRGGPRDRYGLEALIGSLMRRGVLVVVAAGNAGGPWLVAPANAAAALTVGGLNDHNQLDRARRSLYHSNYGYSLSGRQAKPELIAPAIWLAAPVLPGTPVAAEAEYLDRLQRAPSRAALRRLLRREHAVGRFTPEIAGLPLERVRHAIWYRVVEGKFIHPYYQHVDGTSFAAPIVASVAAQMREAHPGLAPFALKRLLARTADPLPGAPREQQGHGALNAGHALAAALRAPGGRLEGVPRSPALAAARVTFVLEDDGYDCVRVVGEFTAWRPQPLQRDPGGFWRASLARPAPGQYVYKFLVDDGWQPDYENSLLVPDGYGGLASLLVA
jgi:serine protease AprX